MTSWRCLALLSQPAFSLSLSEPCLAPATCAVRPTVGVGARIHAMELVHDDEVGDVVMSLVRLLKGVYQLVSTIAAFFKFGPMTRARSEQIGRERIQATGCRTKANRFFHVRCKQCDQYSYWR